MDKIIFKNGESPYINETNLNKVQENTEKAINERKPTIELLTVSDTAPSTCDVGDKYYNTTTSKIYTATATNTWGTEGENPSNLYLYVDLEHKELYYFNGTTFVSYGGGSGGAGGDTLPIGAILPFSSDTVPNGWLLCDGRIVEQADYPELFEVIGTTYGYYSRTDFKLPDLRGRVAVGKNTVIDTENPDTDFNELGKTGGEKTHTLTVSELPSHSHVINSFRQYETGSSTDSGKLGRTTPGADGGDSTIATGKTGGDQPHNNLQPYLVTNYIIKAKMTVAIEGEIIQEDGTASETNVYSASAIDNKLSDLKVIDISSKFTVKFTKTSFKALYYPQSKTIEIWFEINNVSGQNWINIMNINDTSFNILANNYQICYASGGVVVPVRIAKTNMNISVLSDGSKDMFSGFLKIILE